MSTRRGFLREALASGEAGFFVEQPVILGGKLGLN